MLDTRVIRTSSDLHSLVPKWRTLLALAAGAHVATTPAWMVTWWSVFGGIGGRRLNVLAFEEGEDLVGLLPLVARTTAHRRAIPVRRIELLGTGEDEADEICSDYAGALAAQGREREVARAAAIALSSGCFGEWDELRMPAMSGEDPVVGALAAELRACGIAVCVAPAGACPYVPLPRKWEDYLRALGSTRRYLVTRTLRDLDRCGPWELCRARSLADLAEGRRALHELHAERWTAAGEKGVFASPRFTRFHDALMPRLLAGEDGAGLLLSWLVVRGRPIAAAYDLVYAGRVCFYQGGRAIDVPKGVRPGIAMHALSIRSAIETGAYEYDFLAGEARYKRDLSLATRPLVTLRAVAQGLRSRAVEAARVMAERAIARIRPARAPTPVAVTEEA